MTGPDMEAIACGYHSDPFRVLGPHHIRKSRGKARWEVWAFLPQTERASVVKDGAATPMRRQHDQGIFRAELEGEPAPYRLQAGGLEFEDPYRFPPLLTDFEIHLHGEGTHYESYNALGAHLAECERVPGVRFAVWAPNADVVSLIGDFNQWDSRRHPMRRRNGGIWEIFMPHLDEGAFYKYDIRARAGAYQQEKSDPYAFASEAPPRTASQVVRLDRYQWSDSEWMTARSAKDWLKAPVSIYEVHLESWMRDPAGRPLSYREMAHTLVEYVKRMGYTHIELMPVAEHPFSGSWGYQVIGHYAPTSRFGSPEDFMYLVDCFHQAGIGVYLDWVPAHFPRDPHGLAYFDGTALYEHADPRQGEHRDWGTLVFNYGRNEVREFLISNALFWLKFYHIDGLRVDAVASMLYLDYSRQPGEWVPNKYGGNENLEAIDFLRRFNELAHTIPGVVTVAEESTAFSGVSRPVYLNGLGFTMKWNMGWMHDMLDYFGKAPIHRKYHHHNITFSLLYAFQENFVLPVSHDEVVHGKGSLLSKMPGDEWQQFANARAFLTYMYTHPGKKLHFMGTELGQRSEWDHNSSAPWYLIQYDVHRKLQTLVRELNLLYRSKPALYQVDFHYTGFEWVDFHDAENSVIAFLRRSEKSADFLLVCCNFTPIVRHNYEIGAPVAGYYREIFNTDAEMFGGSGVGNAGGVHSKAGLKHGRKEKISITLPPLGVVIFELVK